jgi:hypothetical protein
MIELDKLTQVMARSIARCILKMELHPVVYFVGLWLCLVQTALCFLSPQCTLFAILKWFDLSLYLDARPLLYLLAVPCLACACLLLAQHYWAACSEHMETSISQHYAIKAAITTGFLISHTLCLTQVRCAVAMLASPNAADQAIAALALLFFLGVVYPYSMFLLTDLSPQNGKVFAFVSFPNCFTFLHIYRPVAALMASTSSAQYVIIPTSLLLIVLVVGLLKQPIITWKYNRVSQSAIAVIVWLIFIRILELVSGTEQLSLACLISAPAFVFLAQWLLHRRLLSIVSNQKNSVLRLKTVYFLVVNAKDSQAYLDTLLAEHYRNCSSVDCRCHIIFQSLHHQKTMNEAFCKKETRETANGNH